MFTAPPGPEFLTSTPTCLCSQREWGPGHRPGSPGVQLVILNKLSLCGQITHSCPPLFLLLFTLHYLCDLRISLDLMCKLGVLFSFHFIAVC